MRRSEVAKLLLSEEDKTKEICLNDGSRVSVRGRESWMAADMYLIVQDSRRDIHHVAYHNIASIRVKYRNGARRRPR